MKNKVRVTALSQTGKATIQSGWFADVQQGEAYAAIMLNKGYMVRREYR